MTAQRYTVPTIYEQPMNKEATKTVNYFQAKHISIIVKNLVSCGSNRLINC